MRSQNDRHAGFISPSFPKSIPSSGQADDDSNGDSISHPHHSKRNWLTVKLTMTKISERPPLIRRKELHRGHLTSLLTGLDLYRTSNANLSCHQVIELSPSSYSSKKRLSKRHIEATQWTHLCIKCVAKFCWHFVVPAGGFNEHGVSQNDRMWGSLASEPSVSPFCSPLSPWSLAF